MSRAAKAIAWNGPEGVPRRTRRRRSFGDTSLRVWVGVGLASLVGPTAALPVVAAAPAIGAASTATAASVVIYESLGYPWAGAQTRYNHVSDYDAGYGLAQCRAAGGVMNTTYPKLVIPCNNGSRYETVPAAAQAVNGYAVLDPWGYFVRNCTSFVAWQLYEHGVPRADFEGLGDGGDWAANVDHGVVSVTSTPAAGAVAVSPGHDHVAYVLGVNPDGTIRVAEYNQDQGYRYAGKGDEQAGLPSELGFTEFIDFAPLMNGEPGQLVVGPVLARAPVWVDASPTGKALEGAKFDAVSCTGASDCVAVGRYSTSSRPLVEAYDGVWSLAPGRQPTAPSELQAVSCASSTYCVAVGYTADPNDRPLIETFNGFAWAVTTSPEPYSGDLLGISCVSPAYCVAVGYYQNGSGPLVETFTGATWSLASPKNTYGYGAALEAVQCTSKAFCMAVGTQSAKDPKDKNGALLVVGLSSGAISGLPAPDLGSDFATGQMALSCTSSAFCMLVGGSDGISTDVATYNGKTWLVSVEPSQSVQNSTDIEPVQFSGVACTAPATCAMSGFYFVDGPPASPELSTDVGGRWVNTAPPGEGSFTAVSCSPTSGFCMAVGWGESAATAMVVTL